MSSEDEDSSITISNKKTLITLPENSNKLTYSMNQFIPKVIIENWKHQLAATNLPSGITIL